MLLLFVFQRHCLFLANSSTLQTQGASISLALSSGEYEEAFVCFLVCFCFAQGKVAALMTSECAWP